MHLGQISLCDSVGYNIKSDEDKKRILEELDRTYSVRVIKKHHENFTESRHPDIINRNPYLLSVRSNGNPYYLYLTRCNFVNKCVLIDKKVQQGYFYPRMILVRLWFDDHLFDNTLFEGEMVRDKQGGWTFLINDMMVYRNVPQNDINLVRRVNMVYDILANCFDPDELDVCTLQVKKYFRCSEMHHVVHEFVPRLPYSCRGIYFKPFFFKFRDILLNFDESLIKKIVRKTFKGAGNFLLMSDNRDVVVDGASSQQQSSNNPSEPAATAPQQSCALRCENFNDDKSSGDIIHTGADDHFAADIKKPEKEGSSTDGNITDNASCRVFWVRHTNTPDVYELYNNSVDVGRGATSLSSDSDALVACVPNIGVSHMLQSMFRDLGVTDAVPMLCAFNPKFRKWTPLRRASD